MEPIWSCLCSQEPVIGPCIGSGQSNSDLYNLLGIFFFTCFLIKIWCPFLSYPMRITCLTHPALRQDITLIISGEESISRIVSSRSFYLLFSSRPGMVYFFFFFFGVLAFSTITFHLRRSWTCSVQFISSVFFKSFLTSSSHRDLDLPTGLLVNGFHLYIFFTILISGILFVCPNRLNL